MRSLLLLICFVSSLSAQQPNDLFSSPTISVSGEAELQVVPDKVLITLGVESKAQQLAAAKEDNDRKMQKLLSTLSALGVSNGDLQTDYFNIQPEYPYRGDQQKIPTYNVRKKLVISLRDISKFETVLSASLEAGANFVQGINFQTSDLRKHRDKARAMALVAAKEKATDMSKELGHSIGKTLRINEHQGGYWSYYSGSWFGARGLGTQNSVQAVGAPGSAGGVTAPGRIKITANVSVVFELKS